MNKYKNKPSPPATTKKPKPLFTSNENGLTKLVGTSSLEIPPSFAMIKIGIIITKIASKMIIPPKNLALNLNFVNFF